MRNRKLIYLSQIVLMHSHAVADRGSPPPPKKKKKKKKIDLFFLIPFCIRMFLYNSLELQGPLRGLNWTPAVKGVRAYDLHTRT